MIAEMKNSDGLGNKVWVISQNIDPKDKAMKKIGMKGGM